MVKRTPPALGLAELEEFPGGDLVAAGLADLETQTKSEAALLVSLAAPRLQGLGLVVPELKGVSQSYEHALYEAIEARMPEGAHAEYNALIRRIVSFANAYHP